jgi:hypothetical protein
MVGSQCASKDLRRKSKIREAGLGFVDKTREEEGVSGVGVGGAVQ